MASESKKVGNAAEIDRLALVFAKDPGSKVFIPLAEEYGKAGMWEEAVAVLEDGLKAYPGFITAMVALGRAYEQMNQPVKAKAILEEAIKVSPDNLRAHRILAKLYTAQGAKESAIRSCNVILSLNPHDQEALSLCAGLEVPTTHGVEASSQEQLREKPAKTVNLDVSRPLGEGRTSAIDDVTLATKDETHKLLRSVPRSEEMAISTTGSTDSAAQKTRSPAIARLEQWLNLIQDRRRDPQVSS
ncbi:MAG: tetratricopeptide repeat protein [Nitrospira sp.]|nr:tetratricopeptide repeat protein [Nitrospira sp.]MDH4250783.1 tetratricopeptide repeat protein [Nitrospira sp.]MDH4342801.1 tetratricopeptide repeat protein [Nitrospira sp.]MDH5336069.1 tetratricopeptide repeat protein [Nitrospira sp.]